MRAFLDTSSLVKLYHLEAGSAALKAQLVGDVQLVATQLTWVESTSAFSRIVRRGDLEPADGAIKLGALRTDWLLFDVIPIDDTVFAGASYLLEKYNHLALRSLDAIQLAAALAAGPLDALFTHDQRLHDAAMAEGLPVR